MIGRLIRTRMGDSGNGTEVATTLVTIADAIVCHNNYRGVSSQAFSTACMVSAVRLLTPTLRMRRLT